MALQPLFRALAISNNRADNTNITGIVDGLAANNNEALTYDDAARLTGATSGAVSYGTRAWTYDNNGNRLSETANGVANSYTYPANSNRLTNVKQGTTTKRAFNYDAAGNMTKDTRGIVAYNYAVNNAGRIKTLTIGTALKATWTYDGFQKLRVKTTTSPVATTHYLWDTFGHIIAEHASAGGVQKEYIWLGDTPLAVLDGANLFYVHPDHLDRPVMMTNATAQTIAWQAKYDPFGNAVTVTSSITNNQRLPGQWFQIEDGLAYNWHRNYDPTLGRYSQADPLGFVDGPSVYAYAGSSPVMGVDPSGLHSPEFKLPNISWPAPRWYSPITWPPIMYACYQALLPPMMAAPGNHLPTNIKLAWANDGGPPDKCKWLQDNRDKFKKDDVKTAEKVWGCRRSRANR
jgi:RHS repeat-associated protein